MASSAPTSALRQLFENRLSQLSTEVEALFAETRDRARRDFAEQINQGVRRIRQASDSEELAATLVDTASLFAAAVAFLRIDGDAARGERIRGVPPEAAERFPGLAIALASAPALAGAVETRDPVTAVPTENEFSAPLAGIFEPSSDDRATIFPILVRDAVRALLYTSGGVQTAAIETLCQVGAAVWASIEPVVIKIAPPTPELIQIVAPGPTPAPAPTPERARPTWESLPPEEQQVHLKAQRFARVQISQMRLQDAQAVQSGRTKRDLYGALRQRIDDTRTAFHDQYFTTCPSMVDYLHLELVRTLAHDDADLLGKDYPGPLV
jgi:hypothetical protein